MGDTSIKFEVIPGKNQKSEYVMTCGKHTVRGWCKYDAWFVRHLNAFLFFNPFCSVTPEDKIHVAEITITSVVYQD